ncbi:diaminopimelate epimerase [Clostridium sp. AM58-1XD]|uniref:diaminopimelate epimerase n=1 Tax=Clostridium sp. AM58-1XD TaxID=2292307 RepID=UPI000E4BE4EF|nr:diaminopimelate epimerase [Clostridium sp. AM58-1XD]RGY96475.1 diaminopimelate epimerase [Clostridium sp. AM58-1XD]
MKFTKMHGIGNDYVYVNCFEEEVEDPSAVAVKVSDRHFGIGSDGLILIKPSDTADCQMDMYNLDGSRGAMCGNGIRCVGKYVYDHGIVFPDKKRISVETPSGIKYLDLQTENGTVRSVTVDMGEPELTSRIADTLEVNGTEYVFTGISMGNPHAVLFLEGKNLKQLKKTPMLLAPVWRAGEMSDRKGEAKTVLDLLNLETTGPEFEAHERFPDRTNTEFIVVEDETHLLMRVWERGSGETLACGTGTCASAAAAVLNGYAGKDTDVDVSLLGGHLIIRWCSEDNHIYMTGEATEVFSGEIEI